MHALDHLSDNEMLAGFLSFELPPSAFDHHSHLRIAWIHLQRYPLDEAVRRTCDGIARFAKHLGVTEKFNWTLTEALIRLMAQAGATDPALGWDAFLEANPELRQNARAVVARYYSDERLALPEARAHFLAPDITALPA
ncbi:MAG: hypothetical protein P8Y78_06470 [Acidihalobacter sp.]